MPGVGSTTNTSRSITFSRSALEQERELLARIKAFQKARRGNKLCADCLDVAPTYVCMNFGIFVCTTCAGIHREFSHKVKGISVSTWSPNEVAFIEAHGNEAAKDAYLARYTAGDSAAQPSSGDCRRLRQWIKAKYIDLRWAATPEPAGAPAGQVAGERAPRRQSPRKQPKKASQTTDLLGLSDPDFFVNSPPDPFADQQPKTTAATAPKHTDDWMPFETGSGGVPPKAAPAANRYASDPFADLFADPPQKVVSPAAQPPPLQDPFAILATPASPPAVNAFQPTFIPAATSSVTPALAAPAAAAPAATSFEDLLESLPTGDAAAAPAVAAAPAAAAAPATTNNPFDVAFQAQAMNLLSSELVTAEPVPAFAPIDPAAVSAPKSPAVRSNSNLNCPAAAPPANPFAVKQSLEDLKLDGGSSEWSMDFQSIPHFAAAADKTPHNFV